jgi:hypothetical protein
MRFGAQIQIQSPFFPMALRHLETKGLFSLSIEVVWDLSEPSFHFRNSPVLIAEFRPSVLQWTWPEESKMVDEERETGTVL